MKNNLLLWGAVAVGAYLIYKKMQDNKNNPTGREIAPPPVSNTKPAPRSLPAERGGRNAYLPNGCPTKETLASSRFTKAQMDKFREMGCLDN